MKSFLSRTIGIAILASFLLLTGCPTDTDPRYGYELRISNNGYAAIVEVYISPCSSSSWGLNQISSAIYPGYYTTVSGISEGCYDLLAYDTNGNYWKRQVYMDSDLIWTLNNTKSEDITASIEADPTLQIENIMLIPVPTNGIGASK